MTGKTLGGLVAATALSLVLAACGGGAPTAPSSAESSSSAVASSAASSSEMSSSSAAAPEASSLSEAASSSSSSSAPAAPAPGVEAPKVEGHVDPMKLMAPMAIPDKVIGNPDAKVTVIEYLSPTCPHCALVATTVIGPFIDKYVKTGKVKFIPRPFSRNTLDSGIFMLAEAYAKSVDAPAAAAGDASSSSAAAPAANADYPSPAASQAWESMIDAFFRTQQVWGTSDKPVDAIKAIATQFGFSDATFSAALTDQDMFNKIATMQQQAAKDFGLGGTPTFYINGQQYSGEKSLAELSAIIDPML